MSCGLVRQEGGEKALVWADWRVLTLFDTGAAVLITHESSTPVCCANDSSTLVWETHESSAKVCRDHESSTHVCCARATTLVLFGEYRVVAIRARPGPEGGSADCSVSHAFSRRRPAKLADCAPITRRLGDGKVRAERGGDTTMTRLRVICAAWIVLTATLALALPQEKGCSKSRTTTCPVDRSAQRSSPP